MLRIACSRMAGLVTSNSRYGMPVSALKRSAPFQAASLNDLSNLLPMSKTIAGVKSSAPAVPLAVPTAVPPNAVPTAARAAPMNRLMDRSPPNPQAILSPRCAALQTRLRAKRVLTPPPRRRARAGAAA